MHAITTGEHQLKLECETSQLLNALDEKLRAQDDKMFSSDGLKMTACEQFIV